MSEIVHTLIGRHLHLPLVKCQKSYTICDINARNRIRFLTLMSEIVHFILLILHALMSSSQMLNLFFLGAVFLPVTDSFTVYISFYVCRMHMSNYFSAINTFRTVNSSVIVMFCFFKVCLGRNVMHDLASLHNTLNKPNNKKKSE